MTIKIREWMRNHISQKIMGSHYVSLTEYEINHISKRTPWDIQTYTNSLLLIQAWSRVPVADRSSLCSNLLSAGKMVAKLQTMTLSANRQMVSFDNFVIGVQLMKSHHWFVIDDPIQWCLYPTLGGYDLNTDYIKHVCSPFHISGQIKKKRHIFLHKW